MASNTLSGAGVTPANTKAQILHIGTGTPGVATVRTGDGATTALSFVSGGAKVTGTFEATGAMTVGGAITALGVPVILRVTSNVTAATTTQVALTELDFTPVSGAVYLLEMALIATSAATTTGVQLVNTGGAGTLAMAEPNSAFSISAIGGTYAATSAPVATNNFGISLSGVFTASSTAPLTFTVKSEVASSQVVIKTGSFMKITRVS
jgi:hypothetical protein